MPKEDKTSKPDAKPSVPIGKEKEKDKGREKLKGARHLEHVKVSAKGTIASGTWVAELDGADVRKNKLRS